MSEEQSNERETHIKAADDPEVEGHSAVKASIKATDDPESSDEPDVEGHAFTKNVTKIVQK